MIDFDMIKTGQRIKELRLGLEMSQTKLAEQIDVAQNTIAQYEKGTAKMSIDVLVQMAVALKTSADYLLGLED